MITCYTWQWAVNIKHLIEKLQIFIRLLAPPLNELLAHAAAFMTIWFIRPNFQWRQPHVKVRTVTTLMAKTFWWQILEVCVPQAAGWFLYFIYHHWCKLLDANQTSVLFPESNGQGLSEIPEGSTGQGSYQVRGPFLTIKQFFALLIKRWHHASRSWKDFVAQVTSLISLFIN